MRRSRSGTPHSRAPPAIAGEGILNIRVGYILCMFVPEESAGFLDGDAFAGHCGVELDEVAPGRARVKMVVRDHHRNSHGTVHGGALFTLADTAFALASNSHGIPAAAINAHISYMKAATTGTLYAEAEEFALNPKLATYTVTVTDGNGERIAIFQGMVYRKTPRPS
jgi:acyl-CoA thioesterase